jgi:hypothetical protein
MALPSSLGGCVIAGRQAQEVCLKNGEILLAKSLQGDKRNPYSALRLSLSG